MDLLLMPEVDGIDGWSELTRLGKRKHWSQDDLSIGAIKMRKHIGNGGNTWDQVEELAADLDGSCSLSGLNVDLNNSAFPNSDALLSLPSLSAFKQELLSPFNNNETSLNENENTVHRAKNIQPYFESGIHGVNEYNPPGMCSPTQSEGSSNCSGNLVSLPQTTPQEVSSNMPAQQSPPVLNKDCSVKICCRFQYILAAATSIATKVSEETLTYLNQGQPYEIKLKKLGDLSEYRGKVLKSVVKLSFHERRLQYMEWEQMAAWEASHPGDRILEVDLPLSYGIFKVNQDPLQLNAVEFMWDPTKEVGVYIKVNCISTEFTPKKHGGEKGVPFRIQVETFLPEEQCITKLHSSSCQVKVFKLKGADRKHKQDREKILKRSPMEQEKYQGSCECTILSDLPVSNEVAYPPVLLQNGGSSPRSLGQDIVRKRADGTHVPQNATTVNGVDNEESPQPQDINHNDDLRKPDVERVCPSWSPQQVSVWLKGNRYSTHVHTLASYSGADILRLSKENLTQLCGLADGIRLYNALHSRSVIPHLTVYVCVESRDCIYQAVYLNHLSSIELMKKVSTIVGLSPAQVVGFYIQGPNGIKVLLSDELVSHLPDHSAYVIDVIQGGSDKYQFLLKMSEHSPT